MEPITIFAGTALLAGWIGGAISKKDDKKRAEKARLKKEEREAEERREEALERQRQSLRDQIDRSSSNYLSDVKKIVR